ncbi:MAG: hypothetical protein QW103_02310 [Candidatus Pacearchaeota archaeon]
MIQKRAQFFLLGAIVIVTILFSFFIYQNRIKYLSSDDKIISLKEQFKEESSVVIDYGVANRQDKLKDFLGKMVAEYFSKNPDLELIFFFGNDTHINVLNLAKEKVDIYIDNVNYEAENVPRNTDISLGQGGISIQNINLDDAFIKSYILVLPHPAKQQEKLLFIINETNYNLKLDKYKNFYFLIKLNEMEKTDVVIE